VVDVPVVVETPPVLRSPLSGAQVESERAETVAVVPIDAGDGDNGEEDGEEEEAHLSEAMKPPLPLSPAPADSENDVAVADGLKLTVVTQEEPKVEDEEEGGNRRVINVLIVVESGELEAETGDADAVIELPGLQETL